MAKNIEVNYDALDQQMAKINSLTTELNEVTINEENMYLSQGRSKDHLIEMYKELKIVKELMANIMGKTTTSLNNINVSFKDVENEIVQDIEKK